MRFTPQQMAVFAALSHDENPLHRDDAYAAKTPFGRTVAYGVSGILCALGAWSAGRAFALRSIKATFRKPMFVGDDYDLAVSESDGRATLRWLARGDVHADIRMKWEPWTGTDVGVPAEFSASKEAADPSSSELESVRGAFTYALGAAGLASMAGAFGLEPGRMPRAQLEALCAASYLVGMVVPGRRALFSELDMTFGAGDGPTFRELVTSFDPRFGHVEVTGAGAGLESFRIGAFRRPEVDDGLDALARVVGRSERFAGKTAVVTGSSRGLGAVLVKTLALHGADVVVHYREREDCARRVAAELGAVTDPLVVRADLSDDADCARFAREIVERFGHVDLLVHCAVPSIERVDYRGQSVAELVGYVSRALALAAGPSRALLPAMGSVPGAAMLSISSVYAREPPAGYVHYAAAKAALEGMTVALAREFPDVAFLVVRPPRLVPDVAGMSRADASGSVAAWAAASPSDVAAQVLEHLARAAPGRCEIVDLE